MTLSNKCKKKKNKKNIESVNFFFSFAFKTKNFAQTKKFFADMCAPVSPAFRNSAPLYLTLYYSQCSTRWPQSEWPKIQRQVTFNLAFSGKPRVVQNKSGKSGKLKSYNDDNLGTYIYKTQTVIVQQCSLYCPAEARHLCFSQCTGTGQLHIFLAG